MSQIKTKSNKDLDQDDYLYKCKQGNILPRPLSHQQQTRLEHLNKVGVGLAGRYSSCFLFQDFLFEHGRELYPGAFDDSHPEDKKQTPQK